MEKILSNLALLALTNFCREQNVDCSGSHMVKQPRRFVYTLKNSLDKTLVQVEFAKNGNPKFSFFKS